MKTARRILIENLTALVLGGLAFWPMTELVMRAGVGWTLFGFTVVACWGAFMGYTVKGR